MLHLLRLVVNQTQSGCVWIVQTVVVVVVVTELSLKVRLRLAAHETTPHAFGEWKIVK